MNLAKAMAKENTACYSRKLGVVIVDKDHKVRGFGYNGPPRKTPHTDTKEYLETYFWPQLTNDDVDSLGLMYDERDPGSIKEKFVDQYTGKKICPRKILGCKSGERPNLCSCIHAEANAIANSENVVGCVMYCSTPVPCISCAGLIINAGIVEVHSYDLIYHEQSLLLFKQAGVKLKRWRV